MRLLRAARNRYFGEVTGDWLAARNRSGPLLLGADDRHDLLVDQDGVRRAFDLGLLVAEPGGEPGAVAGAGGRAEREQRVAVEQADLADPPPGAGQQHEDAHGLLVTEPALGGRRRRAARLRP